VFASKKWSAVFARQHGPSVPGIATVFRFSDDEAGGAIEGLAHGEAQARAYKIQLLEFAGEVPRQASHFGLD
jgi:hypothetical protein